MPYIFNGKVYPFTYTPNLFVCTSTAPGGIYTGRIQHNLTGGTGYSQIDDPIEDVVLDGTNSEWVVFSGARSRITSEMQKYLFLMESEGMAEKMIQLAYFRYRRWKKIKELEKELRMALPVRLRSVVFLEYMEMARIRLALPTLSEALFTMAKLGKFPTDRIIPDYIYGYEGKYILPPLKKLIGRREALRAWCLINKIIRGTRYVRNYSTDGRTTLRRFIKPFEQHLPTGIPPYVQPQSTSDTGTL